MEDIQWTYPTFAPAGDDGSYVEPILETADPYVITVYSQDGLSHHAENSVLVQNFVQYAGNTWQPQVTFTIDVTDPCRTSTITEVTLASTMSVVLGQEALQQFDEAADTAGDTYGSAGSETDVCGPRVYEIYDSSSGVLTSAATVVDNGDGTYAVRAYSEDENMEGNHILTLKVTF